MMSIAHQSSYFVEEISSIPRTGTPTLRLDLTRRPVVPRALKAGTRAVDLLVAVIYIAAIFYANQPVPDPDASYLEPLITAGLAFVLSIGVRRGHREAAYLLIFLMTTIVVEGTLGPIGRSTGLFFLLVSMMPASTQYLERV